MKNYLNITSLISELLYKYDCVIVPEFGGFVAQSYSSTFTKGSSLLTPPSKHILFNKNLKHNDGLLTSAYAEKYNCTYDLASSTIADYKDYLLSLLNAKNRFELTDLGLLYIDTDKEIRFEPKVDVNFLIDSFGFEPILANELETVIEPKQVKPVFEDRKISITETPVKKRINKKILAFAIGLPITMAMLLLAVNTKPLQPVMQSSFNPFYSVPTKYKALNYNSEKQFYLEKIAKPVIVTDNFGHASFKLSENGPTLIAFEEKNEIDSKGTIANTINKNAPFQVVVGCFGVEANAKKLISELGTKKIDAAISGLNAKGLHVVSCGGFNTKEDANQLLDVVKSNYPNAWVMAK